MTKPSSKFANEEVVSACGYLSGYQPNRDVSADEAVADFEERLKSLDSFINCGTRFDADFVIRFHQTSPTWVEKCFPCVRHEHVAPTYNEAVEKVLALISKARDGKFYNYREGNLGPTHLRQHERTQACLKKLGDEQKDHDILVVPAQFGLLHRGRSFRRAREVFTASEFGLSAFNVEIMLLTHPERLQHYNDLWIDCAGDEYYDLDVVGRFSVAPCFNFDGGRVGFGAPWFDDADGRCGSASGFLPDVASA